MAPIAKELETLSPSIAGAGATAPVGAKPQPAAVEIPVTVNGARTVEGTDKREPFSEDTQTVLVFANGAVIRLASAVASGQLLFLTNDQTKKEVVCQVVKSKNYSRENGYVELEFTEAAPGFWGMRFPSGGATAGTPVAAKLATPIAVAPQKPLAEKFAEEKPKPQPTAVTGPGKPVEVSNVAPVAAAPPVKTLQERPTVAVTKPQSLPAAEPLKPAETRAAAPKELAGNVLDIAMLSEILAKDANIPQPRVLGQEKSATPRQNANEGAKTSPELGTVLQEQLSSLLFRDESEAPIVEKKSRLEAAFDAKAPSPVVAPEKKEVEARVNAAPAMKANPAPGASTFDFDAEEVKIPAWLEPLAKNSAASTAIFETKTPEIKANEAKVSGISADSADHNGQEDEVSTEEIWTEQAEKHEGVLTLSSEGPTPNFGSSLALDGNKSQSEPSESGSRKGSVLGLLAAGLLLAAGGGWYWYTNQPHKVGANGSAQPQSNFATTAPSAAAPASHAAASPAANFEANEANAAANHNPASAAPAKGDSSGNAVPAQRLPEAVVSTPEPVAKPKLGDVHLAAPVNRSARAMDNGGADSEPTLNESGDASGDAGSLGLLTGKSNQPVAPLPVGGDVKQARLISSVAPVYPQLARSQRLGGDVTIDALVDVYGKVSTMKVISGPAMLHQAAMDALKQWKYQPAMLNGQPTPMHLTVTLQFKLP